MTDICRKVIDRTGRDVTVTQDSTMRSGRGVICPVKSPSRKNGAVTFGSAGISSPHRYHMYTQDGLMDGITRGAAVSDGELEYYVLWSESFKSCFGSYTKTCMLQSEGREHS